ncbi:MAG: hypothetical protein CMJ78_18845 [Planctomycetaceae bacterium]|nr:hypothetical protein [Planctomycetaceae bacterium]
MFQKRDTSAGREPAGANGEDFATRWYEIVESYGGLTGAVAKSRRKTASKSDSNDHESTQIRIKRSRR